MRHRRWRLPQPVRRLRRSRRLRHLAGRCAPAGDEGWAHKNKFMAAMLILSLIPSLARLPFIPISLAAQMVNGLLLPCVASSMWLCLNHPQIMPPQVPARPCGSVCVSRPRQPLSMSLCSRCSEASFLKESAKGDTPFPWHLRLEVTTCLTSPLRPFKHTEVVFHIGPVTLKPHLDWLLLASPRSGEISPERTQLGFRRALPPAAR